MDSARVAPLRFDPVTIAIPARNAARTISSCLDAVFALDPQADRVIVLDDHSTDDTPALARSLGAEVVAVPDPGGLGIARNTALRVCRSRYLAFLNADCYPDPDWLSRLRHTLVMQGATVAGGRQLELRRSSLAERWKAVHLRQDLGTAQIVDPDFLSGGNLLIDIEQVGPVRFDDRFVSAYEDVDFCRRLRGHGRKLVYEPAATVGHDHAETLATLPRKVWSYGVNSRAIGPTPACLVPFERSRACTSPARPDKGRPTRGHPTVASSIPRGRRVPARHVTGALLRPPPSRIRRRRDPTRKANMRSHPRVMIFPVTMTCNSKCRSCGIWRLTRF